MAILFRTTKGRRAAATVGRHFRDQHSSFDSIVASPAARVQQTLESLAEGYGEALTPRWDRRIYLASAATLLDVVREQSDAAATLLMAGHNPGLEDLVLLLVPDGDRGLRHSVEAKYPTASVAVLEFAIDHWADAAEGGATLASFTRPRDLDPSLGPDVD